MPLYKEAGLKSAQRKRPPNPCNHQAQSTKDNPTPQPRAVQPSKCRQSGKRPAGDGADLVVVQAPATASHRVSKRSHSHRSPKISLTAQTTKPPSHISHIYPLPIRLPLLLCRSPNSLLVSRVCGCTPRTKCTPARSQTKTQKSPSSSATPLHVIRTHSKEIKNSTKSY
jgi:hypothetical protein